MVLIISGNLSFLNWLTIVPSLACFDDVSLGFLFHSAGGAKKAVLEIQREDAAGRTPKPGKGSQLVVARYLLTSSQEKPSFSSAFLLHILRLLKT